MRGLNSASNMNHSLGDMSGCLRPGPYSLACLVWSNSKA